MNVVIVFVSGVIDPRQLSRGGIQPTELTGRDSQLVDRKKLAGKVVARAHLGDAEGRIGGRAKGTQIDGAVAGRGAP